jgi:hypothetical protein
MGTISRSVSGATTEVLGPPALWGAVILVTSEKSQMFLPQFPEYENYTLIDDTVVKQPGPDPIG